MGNDRNQSWQGATLVVLSAFAFSTAGFFTRLIDTDVWTMLFWRGLFGGLFIAGYILWRLGSVFFGPLLDEWGTLGDAIWRERISVGLLAAATLLIGLVPSVVADMSAGGVAPIAARLAGLGS